MVLRQIFCLGLTVYMCRQNGCAGRAGPGWNRADLVGYEPVDGTYIADGCAVPCRAGSMRKNSRTARGLARARHAGWRFEPLYIVVGACLQSRAGRAGVRGGSRESFYFFFKYHLRKPVT